MGRVVEIDVSAVQTAEQLHNILFQELLFPDYYGNNWDAFDECISDSEIDLPERVLVRGIDALAARLPREAALFQKCTSYPEVIPAFEWLA
jgi:RNAse (barnase) inhibitor barstar